MSGKVQAEKVAPHPIDESAFGHGGCAGLRE